MVSMDPWGHMITSAFGSHLEKGIDVRPTVRPSVVAMCCNVLQCVAVCCGEGCPPHCPPICCCSVLQCVAEKGIDVRPTVRPSVVAVCCSVLQCVAVCCRKGRRCPPSRLPLKAFCTILSATSILSAAVLVSHCCCRVLAECCSQ